MYIYIGDDCVLHDNHELSASICISADDIAFPYPEYRDFLYPILCDWTDILLGHTNSKTARYELRFLGSGYQMNIRQDSEKVLEIAFDYVDKHLGRICLPYDELMLAVYDALVDFKSILYQSELNAYTDLSGVKKEVSESIQKCKTVITK